MVLYALHPRMQTISEEPMIPLRAHKFDVELYECFVQRKISENGGRCLVAGQACVLGKGLRGFLEA
jgi:hypothetical protein